MAQTAEAADRLGTGDDVQVASRPELQLVALQQVHPATEAAGRLFAAFGDDPDQALLPTKDRDDPVRLAESVMAQVDPLDLQAGAHRQGWTASPAANSTLSTMPTITV